MADALLGYPTEIRRGQGNTLTDGIGHFLLGYIHDDWRVSSNLTVNLGLMYQLGTRPYDSTDQSGQPVGASGSRSGKGRRGSDVGNHQSRSRIR